MFIKGQATDIHFLLIDKDTGVVITTGSPEAQLYKDGAASGFSIPLSVGSNYLSNGVWTMGLSMSQMNADSISISITHVDAITQLVSINTFERDMNEIFAGITAIQAGVNITEVNGVSVSNVSDFHVNTSGLSTFDHNVDFVTLAIGTVPANIEEVNTVGVTIGDFRATGITATVSGMVNANVIQVASSAVSSVADFHVNTSGLSTFDYTTDFITVAVGGITSTSFASSGINSIVNGIFSKVIDGSITMETLSQMQMAWMAGKITVTDNGANRTISFIRRDGSTESFNITVDETDSQEGQRTATGTIL